MKHAIYHLAALCAAFFLCLTSAHAAQVPVAAWICQGQERTGLPGAVFALSTQPDDPGQVILTTDETGRLVFHDLSEGTYYLHQLQAPGLYRPLRAPLQLQLAADGSMRVNGHTADEVSLLHRSGKPILIALGTALSLLPMVVRLIWLYFRENK